jgi:hypothetical protein
LDFPKDYDVMISGSSFNDDTYSVQYAYYNGTATVIKLNEILPSSVADGNITR